MLETLSPQDAVVLFRNGGALFVDIRTEKEFLKRAIPGCPLVPLDVLRRTGKLDARFSGKFIVFFCRSGRRTCDNAALLERCAPGRACQLGGGYWLGNRPDFRSGAPGSCCPVLRRRRVSFLDFSAERPLSRAGRRLFRSNIAL